MVPMYSWNSMLNVLFFLKEWNITVQFGGFYAQQGCIYSENSNIVNYYNWK